MTAWELASVCRRSGEALLDLLYPPRCVGCGGDESWLCAACRRFSPPLEPPWCPSCGAPGSGARCASCRERPLALHRVVAARRFDGPIREAIHALKYANLTVLSGTLGSMIAASWEHYGDGVDLIVPVPLHASRQRRRGYNQSLLLARVAGSQLRIPVDPTLMRRVRATEEQLRLSVKRRWSNVHGAFRVRADMPRGSHILLVDDVCTTGATLDACARVLLDAGATRVSALVVARRFDTLIVPIE